MCDHVSLLCMKGLTNMEIKQTTILLGTTIPEFSSYVE